MKGLAFRSALRALGSLRGEDAVERALRAMAPEIANPLRYGEIVAPRWYPVASYRAMWRGIRATNAEGVEIARLIGREATRADLNAVHKMVLRLLSPKTIASVGARLFSSFYDPAKAEIESRPRFTRARYTRCYGFDQNMWTEILGATEIVLELAGVKNVRCRIVSGGKDGDDEAELEAHWTDG